MGTTTVLLHVDPEYQGRFRPWLEAAGRLHDSGYEVTMRGEGTSGTGDLNVIQSKRLRKPDSKARRLLDHHPIVYERSATETVAPVQFLRELLADRRVRAHLKDTLPRDRSLHNRAAVDHRLHLSVIDGPASGDVEPLPPGILLDDGALAKICSFQPIHMFPLMDMYLNQENPPLAARPIDVSFAGTVEYHISQVTRHRYAAVEAIRALRCKTRAIAGRDLSRVEYRALLADSKIFVSPYGYGGFSWKDFEALYMGAIVVKPDCSFTTTYGFDPYGPGGYLVTCRPDFADLDEVVASVLDDLPRHSDIAERNRAAIHAARDLDALAEDLIRLFSAVRDGGPLPPVRELGPAAPQITAQVA